MNLSHSIFTVPPILNSKDDSNPSGRRPIKRSRSSSTHPPTTTASSHSRSHGSKAARHSTDQVDALSSWTSTSSSSLQSDNSLSYSPSYARAIVPGESTGIAAARGPPPQKKLCSPIQTRQNLPGLSAGQSEVLDQLGPYLCPGKPESRPSLPLRLSSSEVKSVMLGKPNKEEGNKLKTLKLARGSPNSANAGRPRPVRTPSGNGFPGSPIALRTPDSETKPTGLKFLEQIGVPELLDQDDRPTFIIDLGNPSILEPGPLRIIFANLFLKDSMGLLDMVKGNTDLSSPGLSATTAFNEFKSWAISYVKNHQALDVSLPTISYAGNTWTCSNLRRRLRVIRGVPDVGSTSLARHSPALGLRASGDQEMEGGYGYDQRTEHSGLNEPTDYFGFARVSRAPGTPLAERTNNNSEGSRAIAQTPPDMTSRSKKTEIYDHRSLPSRENTSSSLMQERNYPGSRPNKGTLSSVGPARSDQIEIIPSTGQGFFDWTRMPISPTLPPHIRFTRSINWSSTALGPIENWSSELRSMCNLLMASPHPAAMYWGEDLIVIYNEAYIQIAGEKHPSLMGKPYRVAWAEIWDAVKDRLAAAIHAGESTMVEDDLLPILRAPLDGLLEETYFSWAIIPLIGPSGSVVGLYNPAFDKTRRKIVERRMLTLRELGEKTAAAPELKSFWGQVLEALRSNKEDTPFVLMYSLSDPTESDASSIKSNSTPGIKQCILEGSLGVPADHSAASQYVDLKNDPGFFSQVFQEAMKSDQPLFLSVESGTLDYNAIRGMNWRGSGDACRAAVVCRLATGDSTIGLLVLGINPHRPWDDDYSLFVQLLSRQLSTSMASVVLFEEEIARGRRAARLAALDRIQLSEQLAARTQEAVDSETRFTRMAELAPVGIFIADRTGRLTYLNETWYEISKVPKGSQASDHWMDSVKDEDKEMMNGLWYNLVYNAAPFTTEFRFKAPWQDPKQNAADRWVLLSAHPEKNEDGSLKIIFGSITDISKQKWAEHLEKRRVDEAVEMKRQQDNFIDITSHEMRNPLSAILQCADEIASSLADFDIADEDPHRGLANLLENAVDSAQTIALCATHQKRIVDDILTLSKLDSALLLVTPCDVQPVTVAQRALKMFDVEVQTADINLELKVDESMKKLKVEWIRLDPSRLLQVLINLVTNAIKFTTTREKRLITVTMGASLDRPAKEGLDHVEFFPSRSERQDLTEAEEWGAGEKVYIHFSVKDTGRGLTEEETKRLFMRFSQASPRTHVQYGGSGLGLFISRELVELQGGEIGVSSQSGIGSTFAFYVKARRSSAPTEVMEQMPTPGSRKQSAGKGQFPTAFRKSSKAKLMADVPAAADALKVLLVEDNVINQKVLHKQLQNLGCVVYVANHGQECIDLLKKSTFWANHSPEAFDVTVVLMDLEMPVMDGLTCAMEIRKLQEKKEITSHVPIIAVTANARGEQIETALQSGMDDIVSKPFRIPELIPKIEQLSERFHRYPSAASTARSSTSS